MNKNLAGVFVLAALFILRIGQLKLVPTQAPICAV